MLKIKNKRAMKTKFFILVAFIVLNLFGVSNLKAYMGSKPIQNDTMLIQCTPDLYSLTSNWVNDFTKSNPNVIIKIIVLKELTEGKKASLTNLGFVSSEYSFEINNALPWKMVVGEDVIVPILNSKNPQIDKLESLGITREKLSLLVSNVNSLEKEFGSSTTIYILKNDSFKSGLANFLKIEKNSLKASEVEKSSDLISIVERNPNAIGFCMMSDIVNPNSKEFVNNIKPLPIDKNGNGEIDSFERFYENAEEFVHGVWIGKYPKELYRNIYSVSPSKPVNENEVAFLSWVLTTGQKTMNTNGYCDLTSNQRQANIDKLYFNGGETKSSSKSYVIPIALVILTLLVIIYFIIDNILSQARFRRFTASTINVEATPYFDDKSLSVLDGLYFDKSHTWVFMEKDGTVGVGIDDFLQHVTGPISKIKMKEPGEKVKKGEPFLTLIQDGKQLNIKAPISGTIKSQNKGLVSNISLLMNSPYQEGWIYVIEPSNWFRDIQFLIMSQGYKEWLKMEFLHLKDFLAIALKGQNANEYQVVLQDGGEIKNGILRDMKPEIWEDFQTHFLDSSK